MFEIANDVVVDVVDDEVHVDGVEIDDEDSVDVEVNDG
jgi:hypothetical protein